MLTRNPDMPGRPSCSRTGEGSSGRPVQGEPAPTAVVVPTRYLDAAATAKLAEADRPDDWFATELPAEFLPQ